MAVGRWVIVGSVLYNGTMLVTCNSPILAKGVHVGGMGVSVVSEVHIVLGTFHGDVGMARDLLVRSCWVFVSQRTNVGSNSPIVRLYMLEGWVCQW